MNNSDNNSSVTPNNFENLESAIASQINTTWQQVEWQLDAIIDQTSDVYSLSLIAALKQRFILNLSRSIEEKVNIEAQRFILGVREGVGTLTQNFVEGLVDKHLELEESTAQPVAKLPENNTPLSLPSFDNMLQQKREQQSSLISLKLPSQPTNSQLDAMQLMGIDIDENETSAESQ